MGHRLANSPQEADGQLYDLSAPPFVSVVIVNYNGRAFLGDCLTSLARQTFPRGRWEAILVDNGSSDDSVEFVRRCFPWVQLVPAAANLGFARGNNVGIRQARGELIALLNNDTVVDTRWLETLVLAILEDRRIGGVASKIRFKDRPAVINSAGLNLYRDGRGGDRGFRQPDVGQYDHSAEVFGACGASVLLRREMLADVGLFDERFFMYYEDLDLAWRARRRGWRFRFVPSSVVYHVHCGTSGEWSPFFIYHAERNCVFTNLKNAPARQVLRALGGVFGRAVRKWFLVLSRRERGETVRGQAMAYCYAILSLLAGMPGMLWKRYQIRVRRQLVRDGTLATLIAEKPESLSTTT